MSKKALYKTNITIWTDYDPANMGLEELGREATRGGGLCTHQGTVFVEDVEKDDEWGGNEDFFWDPEEEKK